MGANREPRVNVDILVVRDGKILLGLLTEKWDYGGPVWGVPGTDIKFGEKIGDEVSRHIREELGCRVMAYKVICVNANYALGNHYIGIGVFAETAGEPKNLIPEEWKEWRWFPRDGLPKNLFPAAENLIKCFLSGKFIVSE